MLKIEIPESKKNFSLLGIASASIIVVLGTIEGFNLLNIFSGKVAGLILISFVLSPVKLLVPKISIRDNKKRDKIPSNEKNRLIWFFGSSYEKSNKKTQLHLNLGFISAIIFSVLSSLTLDISPFILLTAIALIIFLYSAERNKKNSTRIPGYSPIILLPALLYLEEVTAIYFLSSALIGLFISNILLEVNSRDISKRVIKPIKIGGDINFNALFVIFLITILLTFVSI